MSEAPLIFAIPSKGRIEEGAREFFQRTGLLIKRQSGARDYRGRIDGVPNTDVQFLSASEIASALESGAAHLGITGEDLIYERGPDSAKAILLVMPLGFSHADVVVAVPRAWIDVSSMADLDEVAHDFRARRHRPIRVATKFVQLTRSFFAKHGLVDYRIVESSGATEGAPASGAAEFIVDITTTGATLAANSLKVLDDGVILKSQAQLAASIKAAWSAQARAAATQILETLWIADCDRFCEVSFVLSKNKESLAALLATAFGNDIRFEPAKKGEAQRLRCPQKLLNPVYAMLRSAGASGPIKTESGRNDAGPNPYSAMLMKALA